MWVNINIMNGQSAAKAYKPQKMIKPGTIFNKIKVIDFAYSAKSRAYYFTECITCGAGSIRRMDHIKTNRDEIKENIPKLKKFLHWRNEIKKKKNSTIRVEHNTVAVFSNDLQELRDITNIIPDIEIDITQAQTSNFVGVRYFVRKPKHSYRVYLKSRRVEGSFAEDLHELFKKNNKLYPCFSLKQWAKGSINSQQVSWRYRFSSATHFIDYDDESTLSYLALLHGDMLGKRYKLEKRPDPI